MFPGNAKPLFRLVVGFKMRMTSSHWIGFRSHRHRNFLRVIQCNRELDEDEGKQVDDLTNFQDASNSQRALARIILILVKRLCIIVG